MKATSPTPATPTPVDIALPTQSILQTVHALNNKFGISYLVHILQGENKFGLKHEAHRNLPTFGALKAMYAHNIRQLLSYLIVNRYVATRIGDYPTCYLTDKGKAQLYSHAPLQVLPTALNRAECDRLLFEQLRALRVAQAKAQQCKIFEILLDKTLDAIVLHRPKNTDELLQMEGMTTYKVQHYGEEILRLIDDVLTSEAKQKAKMPAAQAIKALFQQGLKVDEIAKAREISPATAQNYLETLHRAGEIDLIAWAEEHVAPDALYRGTEYFMQVQNPQLKEAAEILGLDYNTLRLCKLYVSRAINERD